MDNRPIGVFDSGIGGLTVLKELLKALPGEDFIYFGDTGRVPYGGRSRETILKYAKQDIRFLKTFDIKALLVACGTVSSYWNHIEEELDIPSVSVVRPSARQAAGTTANNRIGVIGTVATIKSRLYEEVLKSFSPGLQIMSVACPLFVPLVENGRIYPGDIVIETVAREYLEPLVSFGCDTLIMGCTHYPLLERVIAPILPGVKLINPGAESAADLKRLLEAKDLLSDRKIGTVNYYISDDSGVFPRLGSLFLEQNIRDSVRKVEIEEY
jgi:glutamate racemase